MTKRIAILGIIGFTLLLAGCSAFFGFSPKTHVGNPIPLTPVDPSAVLTTDTLPVRIDGDYVEGEIIVGYEHEGALQQVLSLVHGVIRHVVPEIQAALIKLTDMGVPEALGRIAWAMRKGELTGIRYAEPNYIRELIEPIPSTDFEVMGLWPQVYDPNADLRPYQWGMDLVRAEEAWSYATGQGVIVAVVDTGVDGLHPDLDGQVEPVWYDAWNLQWVSGYDSSWGPVYSSRYQRWYDGSHGTHVAGIIAAKNDGKGVTGLAPNARILSIRIFSPDPVYNPNYGHYYVGDFGVAVGIIAALNYGARVFNNSWGGKGYSQTLKAAIDLALDSGAVFLAAMGNSYLDEVSYPAGYPGVIAVGATTPQDKKVDFSTMGGHISVGAPGTRVLSCVPRWMTQAGTGALLLYDYWDGTSMATPFVSALAAIILERHPTATPYQVRRIMEQTAKDVEAPGFDRRTGYGRIDAAQAVQVTSLPSTGAFAAVFVVTKSSGFPIPYVDIILRKNGVDRYYGQTDYEGYYYEMFLDWGGGFFLEIEPGTYEVLVGGEDTTLYWWSWMRVANRVTAKKTVTLSPGRNDPIVLEVNTTLKVTLEWTEAVDLDLAVREFVGYDPNTGEPVYRWSTPKTGALWGTFSSDAQAGGRETYELKSTHWDYDVYYLAIIAYGGSSTAKITVLQNGVTEVYGPYQVTGSSGNPGLYPSNTWTDWWENTAHPYFGVKGPGGPVVY